MENTIQIKFHNYSKIKIVCDDKINNMIDRQFSIFDKKLIFTYQYKKNKNMDTKVHLYNTTSNTLPIGLTKELTTFLKNNNIAYEIDEKLRRHFVPVLDWSRAEEFVKGITIYNEDKEIITPYSYQYDAIYRALRLPQRLLISPTSSGKSLMIYLLLRVFMKYKEVDKILILVPSLDLIKQLYDNFDEYSFNDINFICENEVLKYKTPSKNVKDKNDYGKKIYICNYQGIAKQDKSFFKDFNMIICDEAHQSSNDSIMAVLNKSINAKYRYGFTGTVPKDPVYAKIVSGNFGIPYTVIEYSELFDKESIAQLRVQPVTFHYDIPKRTEGKNYTYIEEGQLIKNRQLVRDNKLLSIASDEKNTVYLVNDVVNGYGDRLFVNAQRMYPDKNIQLITKDSTKQEREDLKQILETTDNNIVIATYKLLGTGWSVNNIHKIVFAQSRRSFVSVMQSIGRVLRKHKNKEYGTVYDIIDSFEYNNSIKKQFKDRMSYYEDKKFIVRDMLNFNIHSGEADE